MAWLPVADAAAVLKISDDTIRRRVKRGELPSREGADGRRLVEVPDPEPQPEPQGQDAEEALAAAADAGQDREAAPEAPAAPLEDAVALMREREHLRELLREREARIGDLSAEMTAARERAAADATERAELRRMLAVLLPQPPQLAAPTYDGEPQVSRGADAGQPQGRRWWRWW